jgi:hypothetical protein
MGVCFRDKDSSEKEKTAEKGGRRGGSIVERDKRGRHCADEIGK